MFLAVHAVVGAVAGNAVGGPVAAFSIGFLSHFILDMIPHGDQHLYENYKNGKGVINAMLYTGFDSLITVALIIFIFSMRNFISDVNVAAGIVGSLLPDLMVGTYELTRPKGERWMGRQLTRFKDLHMRNHFYLTQKLLSQKDIPLSYGVVLQVLMLFVILKMFL